MRLPVRVPPGPVAALGLLLLVLAALWVGPVSAYLDLIDANAARIERKAELLERYRALAVVPAGRDGAAAAAVAVMLPEIPEAQAAALLQQTVKEAAVVSKAQIQNLQVLRSEKLSGAVKIGVRVRAAGDIGSLARLLFAIETARPVLHPDNLQIQSRAGTGAAPGLLDFQLDVSSFKPGSPS